MSKPNVLTQILTTVKNTDDKVENMQSQFKELEDSLNSIENLPSLINSLESKISDIQNILNDSGVADAVDSLKPKLTTDPDIRRNKRSSK
ncbi:p10 [Palpita vitrealis nucleopolyhedrovirus]|uniref:P10 n=1 Tax=Palpita vitrealis nucleopolyhedrovirus TaxID=2951960 RepID=A0AAE9LNL4_9ABAC|nr:p10 [Palpita vitrealis nucleopolyhedrovirus]